MKPHIVYTKKATVALPLIDLLHSFDVHTHNRAYGELQRRFGPHLGAVTVAPAGEPDYADILRVHPAHYLQSLASVETLVAAFGVRALRMVPELIRKRGLIRPMLMAVQGTIVAAERALRSGFAFHIGGGFHHAHPDRAEGSCLFADSAIAVRALRARRLIEREEKILYIDLDAHRGNGVEHILRDDPAVHVLDMYNSQAYPGPPEEHLPPNWRLIPLKPHCPDETYLPLLESELDRIFSGPEKPRLAIYNAGTDVLEGDPLGGLSVTREGVLHRDRLVIDALAQLEIPTVVVAGGGYTKRSHALIADSIAYVLQGYGQMIALSEAAHDQHLMMPQDSVALDPRDI